MERHDQFAEVSIAARGIYAMEFLLFDPQSSAQTGDHTCALIRAVARDIAATSLSLSMDWQGYDPADPDVALFNALLTKLEVTAAKRLGRPMGTFDRPHPNRAEVWRSGRSLRMSSFHRLHSTILRGYWRQQTTTRPRLCPRRLSGPRQRRVA